jgi:2-hydroxy-6-oxonona-2,4-dienedioate hydrolase
MNRRQLLGLGISSMVAVGGGVCWRSYSSAMAVARLRISIGSSVFESRFGTIEFAVAGAGPPAIMIHGTGGGFDQGLAFAAPLVAAGHQVIAPSRFGYLRSSFPADPSTEQQADAIAELMSHLRIQRAAIIGGSAGALSAMQFAIRHPERCSALITIVPAAFAPDHPPPRPNAVGKAIMEYGLKSDFLFWAAMVTAEDAMIGSLLATDPILVRRAVPSEQARVRSILRGILPVSARAAGLLNDARLAGSPTPMPLDRINAPTLAIALEDDRFETLAAARHIVNSVSGARLVSYPDGGHVWVGRDKQLFAEVNAFLASVRS